MEYGRSDVLFARSADGARSFDQPRTVVQNEGVVSTSFFDLFTAPNGRVWVGFLDYRAEIGAADYAPVQIRVVHSDDGGVTFSRSAVVYELSCECCRVDFATQGELLLLGWRQIYPRGQFPGPQDPVRDVAVARSTDGGASWGAPSKLHDDQWVVNQCPHSGPVMQSDSRGALHAGWYSGAADRPGVYYASATHGQQALGAVLGSILTVAAARDSVYEGIGLLAVYSAGLAIPFLTASVALDRFLALSHRFRRWLPWVERASGVLLLAVGLLLVTGSFRLLAGWLPAFDLVG